VVQGIRKLDTQVQLLRSDYSQKLRKYWAGCVDILYIYIYLAKLCSVKGCGF
jgi:hypothetical protein